MSDINIMESANSPAYRIVADTLTRRIQQGKYKPGERLPGSLKLAKMFAISPVTANKVLDTLEASELVSRSPRKGTFVRLKNRTLRRIVIPTAAEWQRHSPQLLAYLSGVMEEAHQCGVEIKLEPYDSARLETADAIRKMDCQGIIQMGNADAMFPFQPLRKSGLSWIVLGVSEKTGQCVVSENREAAAGKLVKVMRKDGYERIGMIANLSRPNHRSCRDGYLQAVCDTGLGASLVRDADEKNLETAIKDLLYYAKTDGIIVSGTMLIRAVCILRRLGEKIPLGGFEEALPMATLRGEVYLVELNHHETGRQAVRTMQEIIGGEKKIKDILLEAKIHTLNSK